MGEWRENGCKDDYLLTGIRLAEARELDKVGDIALQDGDARQLLRLSNEARERQRQRQVRTQRLVIGGLSVLLIAAIIAGFFAIANGNDAAQQRDSAVAAQQIAVAQTTIATSNANRSESERLAASARGVLTTCPLRAVLLGYEAVARENNELSYSALSDAVAQTIINPIATLSGHSGAVFRAVYSPDGQRILTASADGTALLWDKDGKLLATLSGHTGAVNSAVYSPDGSRILTASADKTARLWDKDGKIVATLSGHTGIVYSAVFSPDGQRILTASDDHTARLWDNDGKPIATLSGHTDAVFSAVYSPDGQRILTASQDGTARLWDKDGKLLATLSGHSSYVYSAVFSPDGQRILTASGDTTARLWDKDGKPIAILSGHTDTVTSAVYSPDGQRILTTSFDGTTRLWDKDGKPLAEISGRGLGFSPDSKLFLVTDSYYIVRTYPVYTKDLLAIAACRVDRSLTPPELLLYGIAQPLFHYDPSKCPAQVSWEK